jgi:hypothetical protein
VNESNPKLVDLQSALAEMQRLREENVGLRCLLQEHGIQIPAPQSNTEIPVTTNALPSAHIPVLKAEQRIALFRSLFHGRDDVYAVRWENADGRCGYMPKADRDWKAYLRAKDEDRKKVDRQTRKFRPLTDEVVRGHLVGDHTIGIYPLLQDETCWFLAVDFDKKTWQRDAAAFLAVCCELNVPAALERSRSGNGGHVWIFFDQAIPAPTARKLGCAILTRAMESRHQLGLDSYDRFFPNQDTMPKGGLGNLIALPLQKLPRADGNSVFVDAEFCPYGDQWAFLATVKRMPISAAEAVVLEAQRSGDLVGVRISSAEDEGQDPWTLPPSRKRAERPIPGPFPVQVQVVRGNLLYIEKKDLPSAMLNRLLRLGAFQNPEFYKAQAMRLPTFNKPRVIACGEELADHIALPRGCLAEVIELLKSHRIKPMVRDERFVGRPIEVEFSGRLRPLQQDAVDAFAQHDEGILCAPTAFWQDGSRSMVDCVTEGEHIDLGASSTIAGPVACKIGNVSRSSRKVNRSNRRRGGQTQRLCGYCHSSKRPRQGRGERLRGRVWPSNCRQSRRAACPRTCEQTPSYFVSSQSCRAIVAAPQSCGRPPTIFVGENLLLLVGHGSEKSTRHLLKSEGIVPFSSTSKSFRISWKQS